MLELLNGIFQFKIADSNEFLYMHKLPDFGGLKYRVGSGMIVNGKI
mgnify:CR=1 FL=1